MEPCTENTVESAKDDDNKSSPISVMISDPQVFDCCICFQPLTIHVFLCDNGHIVCSTCCDYKLEKKCDKCPEGDRLKHCKVFDNVLKSIKLSCINRKHGCMETISYSEKRKHEEKCTYVQCKCPLFGCNFVASYELLSNHFAHKHGYSVIKFSYDRSFIKVLKSNEEVIVVLQEQNDGKLFILNNNTTSMGNAIKISYIGPKCSATYYCYDIFVRSEICNLKIESSLKNFQEITLSPEFLLIPFDCFGSSKNLKLEIRIKFKIDIIIKELMGAKIYLLLKVGSSGTISSVKMKIHEETRLSVEHQLLRFANKQLDDHLTIADCNIKEKSLIFLFNRLR